MSIKETIEKILQDLVPGVDVSSNELMEEQGIESLTMIQLISELDLAFDIEITFEDIEMDNFRSVDAMESMVRRHLS